MQFKDGEPVGADLHFEGAANQRRGRADACSKVSRSHERATRMRMLYEVTRLASALYETRISPQQRVQ